ncbi:MAG: ribonuclease E/G, partial [Gallionellaceae bacterium]|nr:ribonuclease E/G [Gallionellaceae bacterium]
RFGLLELSRQRLAPSLEEGNHTTCPRCNGIGHIRGTESSALNILRIIQEEAMKDSSAAIHAQVPVDVATFLLNEKRSDIFRIESRFKINVMLIPNPHLETPHYTVTRLRQDDITSDHLQASYKLVEKPEEIKETKAAQEAKAAQRPQAAVKGITPTQPAPKREEKKTSLIGSLVGWFKSLGGEDKPEKKAAPAKGGRSGQRRDRNERGERSEGGNRQRRDRNERGERSEGKPRRERDDTQRADSKVQQDTRGERPPQQPRQPRPSSIDKPALEVQKPVVAGEQGEEGNGNREGRKRGRRGGRREREKREQQNVAQPGENAELQVGVQSAAVSAPEVTAAAPAASVMPTEYIAYPDSMKQAWPTEAKPAEVTPTEVVCYPAQQPQPVAVVAQEPQPTEVVVTQVTTQIDLSSSGLTMIETDPNKAATVAPVPESRDHAPRRRQRQREVYTVENSEPLQQVETQSPN